MKSVILKSLETNSTTILPEFGSLMKMGKTIMFNEFLKFDDGKITKLYATEKAISEADAKLKVQEFIASIKSSLEGGKPFIIENLGSFIKLDGKIKFEVSTTTPATPKVAPKQTPKIVEKVAPIITTPIIEEPKTEKIIPKEIPKPQAPIKTEPIKEKETPIQKIDSEKEKEEEKKVIEPKKETPKKNIVIPEVKTTEESKVKETVEPPKVSKTPLPKEEKTIEVPKITPTPPKPIKEDKKEDKTKVAPILSKENTKTKTDDLAAIAAISEGLETDKKKQKKGGYLLWGALLCILISGGIFGYLKQDLIKGWFSGTEVANHSDEKEEKHNSDTKDTKHESDDQQSLHQEATENDNSSTKHENEDTNPDGNVTESDNVENTEITNTDQEQTETELIEKEEEVVEIKEKPIEKEEPVKTVASSSTGAFHIVAGSYSTEKNAQKKADKLKKKGYLDAAVLGKFGKLYKVKVTSHTTKEEAKTALKEFKSNGYSGMIKEY